MRWLIRDGDGRGGGGERENGSTAQSDPQKTVEAVADPRQNNLAIVKQLLHPVSTAEQSRVTRTMPVALLLRNN